VLGGWITGDYSWEWIFFINIPIGIFAALVVAAQLRGRPEDIDKPRIDWIGLITLILGVGALQILLDKGNQLDWFQSNTIVTLAIVSAISLTVFLIWELTDDQPIVNLRLFRHRNFAAGTLVLVLAYAAFFSIALLVPLWLQNTLDYTPVWAGLATAPIGIIPVLLTFWVGKYGTRVDLRWLASLAFVVMGVTCFMRGDFNTDVDFYHVALAQLLQGLGVAFFFMPILTILLSDLSGREVADGSGTATFLRSLAGSFAASITTYLWTRGGVVEHSTLAEHVSAYSSEVRSAVAAAGGHLQQYAAGINRVINQQATQISFSSYWWRWFGWPGRRSSRAEGVPAADIEARLLTNAGLDHAAARRWPPARTFTCDFLRQSLRGDRHLFRKRSTSARSVACASGANHASRNDSTGNESGLSNRCARSARANARVIDIARRGSFNNGSNHARVRTTTWSTSVSSSTMPTASASSASSIAPATRRRSARYGPTSRRSAAWMQSGTVSPTCTSLSPILNSPRAMTR
jgi:predicted MFS family arabinose efflux permease